MAFKCGTLKYKPFNCTTTFKYDIHLNTTLHMNQAFCIFQALSKTLLFNGGIFKNLHDINIGHLNLSNRKHTSVNCICT